MTVPPPIRNTGSYAKAVDLETQVDWMMLKVDRLSTAYKILKWVACTAIIAGLTGVGAVVALVYTRGVEDEAVRSGIERTAAQYLELRGDVKDMQRELNKIVYSGRGFVIPPHVEENK